MRWHTNILIRYVCTIRDMFDRLSDFIIEEMYGKNINVNELVHERMEKAGLDFDTAFEEVISDSLEEMLVSENAAQHLKNLYKSDKRPVQSACR